MTTTSAAAAASSSSSSSSAAASPRQSRLFPRSPISKSTRSELFDREIQTPNSEDAPHFPNHAKLICLQALFEDAAEKLGVVSHLKMEEGHEANANVIAKSLQEQKATEQAYQQYVERRAAIVGAKKRDNNIPDELLGKLRSLKRTLKTSIQSETTAQLSTSILHEIKKTKSKAADLFQQSVLEIQQYSDCVSLRQEVSEETQRDLQCEELQKEIEQYTRNTDRLRECLNAEKEMQEREAHASRTTVAELYEELKSLKESLATTEKMLSKDYNAKVETKRRVFALEEEALQRQVDELRISVEREQVSFQYTRDFLSQKIEKAETDLQHWTEKHESETTALTSRLDKLSEERARVLEHLKLCEEQYREETKRKQEREELEIRLAHEKEMMNKAALLIQCVFKGFMARKMVAVMRKEAAKSKKGAKGKGKVKK